MRIAVVGSGGTGGYFGGLLARAGEEVTFNASLRLIEASRGALVLATIPLWSALLARIARSERLVPRQIGGVFLSLGGVGLALAGYDALTVMTYAMVLGTLLLLPAALVEGLVEVLPQLDEQTVALLVFLGVFGGALGFFLWTFALSRLTPTQVAVYINLNPLVAMVLAAALLAEHLTIIFVAGFAAVLMGCCWLTGRSVPRQRLPTVVVKG